MPVQAGPNFIFLLLLHETNALDSCLRDASQEEVTLQFPDGGNSNKFTFFRCRCRCLAPFVQGLFQKLSFLYRGPMGVFLDFHHFNLKSRDRGGRQQAVDRVMEGSSNHIEVSSMEVVLFFLSSLDPTSIFCLLLEKVDSGRLWLKCPYNGVHSCRKPYVLLFQTNLSDKVECVSRTFKYNMAQWYVGR